MLFHFSYRCYLKLFQKHIIFKMSQSNQICKRYFILLAKQVNSWWESRPILWSHILETLFPPGFRWAVVVDRVLLPNSWERTAVSSFQVMVFWLWMCKAAYGAFIFKWIPFISTYEKYCKTKPNCYELSKRKISD